MHLWRFCHFFSPPPSILFSCCSQISFKWRKWKRRRDKIIIKYKPKQKRKKKIHMKHDKRTWARWMKRSRWRRRRKIKTRNEQKKNNDTNTCCILCIRRIIQFYLPRSDNEMVHNRLLRFVSSCNTIFQVKQFDMVQVNGDDNASNYIFILSLNLTIKNKIRIHNICQRGKRDWAAG